MLPNLRITISITAIALSLPPVAVAADKEADPTSAQPKVLVRLITSQERILSGLPVRAWRAIHNATAWEETKQEASFDGSNCYMQLPPGDYRFEVLTVLRSGEVLCVRSEKTTVSDEAVTVEMPAVTKHRVLLKHRGRTLPINHVAIASLGNQEARWQSFNGVKVGTILATTGESLALNLIGGNEKLIVAGWQETKAQKKMAISTGKKWYQTLFEINSKTPRLKAARVEILFPTTKVEVLPDGPFTLITNRRVIQMRYGLISTGGQRFVTTGCLLSLDKFPEIKLGGLLHVEAWAAVLTKDDGEKTLRWEATLLDSERREISLEESEIEWKSAIRFQNGDVAPDNPLSEAAQQLVDQPEKSMECLATWNWAGKHQFAEPPSPMAEYRSKHFVLRSPRPWHNRANSYLRVLERTFLACQARTNHKGPEKIDIHWRTNTHNAKARVGGRHSWMSMPFRGFERATDPFRRPWFMTHEMLHTYGYNHGAEMTRLSEETAVIVDNSPWLALDQENQFSTSIKLSKETATGEVPVEKGEEGK